MSATFSTVRRLETDFLADLANRAAPRRLAVEPVPCTAFAALDSLGECDCCGRQGSLALVIVSGIETYACSHCRGAEEPYTPTAEDLRDHWQEMADSDDRLEGERT